MSCCSSAETFIGPSVKRWFRKPLAFVLLSSPQCRQRRRKQLSANEELKINRQKNISGALKEKLGRLQYWEGLMGQMEWVFWSSLDFQDCLSCCHSLIRRLSCPSLSSGYFSYLYNTMPRNLSLALAQYCQKLSSLNFSELDISRGKMFSGISLHQTW